ncbi:hypothetical protein [Streptomyces sp. NPDC001492]
MAVVGDLDPVDRPWGAPHVQPPDPSTARPTALAVTVIALVVEVESDKAQALAENVGIGFDAESESDTVGITEIRVVLPEGIAPADVSYGEAPRAGSSRPPTTATPSGARR